MMLPHLQKSGVLPGKEGSHCHNHAMGTMCTAYAFWAPPTRARAPSSRNTSHVPSVARISMSKAPRRGVVTVLDYGAGNVRSLENAVRLLGFDIEWAETAADIRRADKLLFPGVGSFGAAMQNLHEKGFVEPLKEYISADRPFLGICLGMHTLFEASEESPGVPGLGILPGTVRRFCLQDFPDLATPHIGWNTLSPTRDSLLLRGEDGISMADAMDRFYFVHSFRVGLEIAADNPASVLSTTTHGEEYVSIVQRGHMCATQFHPEKSGAAGLRLIENFLTAHDISAEVPLASSLRATAKVSSASSSKSGLAKRVVACLDVRENDTGDLVVTKGDQYDVREKTDGNAVRNLGKPVDLARQYFEQGADEICFLNITSFRGEPVGAAPMIEVLERTSEAVFVPLCIGGGIRDYTDRNGVHYTALDVASMYFRAGADKISLGSDAVYAAEKYIASGGVKDGSSSIETISHVYGSQAVVVSVDPQRVYVDSLDDTRHSTVTLPDGRQCWYQCTVKGGREGRDLDVVQLVRAAEKLGAGEILVNSMDQDGQNNGYDLQLIRMVRSAVSVPVIASSGAGIPEHFTECFDETGVEAALAAGIFHRQEVSIDEVKTHLRAQGTPVRVVRLAKKAVA